MIIKICNVLTSIMLVVLLILAVFLVGPNLIGYSNYVVLSGSMEPNIPEGGLVTVNPNADKSAIQKGDVITYTLSQSMLSTHRVVSNDTELQQFVTKGDANASEDANPVSYDRVIGKVVFSVPYLGYLVNRIQSADGILLIAVVLVAVILLTFIPIILKPEGKQSDLISPRFVPAEKIVSRKKLKQKPAKKPRVTDELPPDDE